LIGDEEMKSGEYTLKNMNTGEQVKAGIEQIIEQIKSK
jgi:histidyl-tRNA synthetase